MNRHFKIIALLIMDIAIIIGSFLFAVYLSDKDFLGFPTYFFLEVIVYLAITKILIFLTFNLYSTIWKYASIQEMKEIFFATAAASAVSIFIITPIVNGIWIKTAFIDWMLNMFLIGGARLGLRILKFSHGEKEKFKNVIVYGAGKVGASIIKELIEHPLYNPIAIIDDDTDKKGSKIHGIPVQTDKKHIENIIKNENIEEIIIAIPSLDKLKLRKTFDIYKKLGCKVKTLPGVNDMINGRVGLKQVRDVNIEDILGREPVHLDIEEISEYIKSEIVLVTGGGGSIGSELCRHLAGFEPQKLLILDINENDSYFLQQELKAKHPSLDTRLLIGSITDELWIERIFETYKPGVVFHAAAHKHVPLMEENPFEAVKNNVFGTFNVAIEASKSNVKRFVLISTDKAVNAASIMGVTKRISEIIIQSLNKPDSTRFSAVRFGNVLGSKGSVIPLFEKQIEWSNCIKITHPEVTRYFMTISEAVQLVIQAGAMAKGGDVFVLDMGTPVKVLDLAKDLIRLLESEEETKIAFVGLRPGEKINEKLFTDNSKLEKTQHSKIFIEKEDLKIDFEKLSKQLNRLQTACIIESEELVELLTDIVPEFKKV